MLPASRNLRNFEKMFRSLNATNFGSVGQRALKLLAVKIGVLKKKFAALAIPARICERSGSNQSQSLTGL